MRVRFLLQFCSIILLMCRSQWPRVLRRRFWGRSPAEIVGSNPTGGMDVCCECCVLSGRGLCDELITRPEESYRLWCVVCDLEKPQEWGGYDPLWVAAPQKKKLTKIVCLIDYLLALCKMCGNLQTLTATIQVNCWLMIPRRQCFILPPCCSCSFMESIYFRAYAVKVTI